MNDTLHLSRRTLATLLGPLTGHAEPNPQIGADVNPPLLPPRAAFAVALARAVIDRAGLMQDVAEGLARENQQRGIIIVSGYLSRFIDDCGSDRLPRGIPLAGPRPHDGARVGMLDLLLMGAEFERHAQQLDLAALAQEFRHVGVALTELGLARS